jgi:glucosyl-3-phosphoglycerate synthase
MSNFAQKHTKICTFYLLNDQNPQMELELMQYSKWKKAVLVIPLLASEFTESENRPVFENIARQLSEANYLSQIIFGLDQAGKEDALDLASILKDSGVKNYLIQHNDGEGFSSIYRKLSDAGFGFQKPGKGRNMFLSFGIALALGAQTIGIIDADIRTFQRRQLDRLFYPVQVLNYQFSKAFYARIKDNLFYGRVKRLLLDPLLISLQRKFTDTQEEKVLRLVDFLLNFNYQLSGEVVFDSQLLKRMQIATDWGVEIFTLIEVYRKATTCAQVEISAGPFDHKHQPVSEEDRTKGLYRMGIDVVSTLLSALVIEEGLEINEHFIRDLTTTYLSVADDLIKMYADNAAFCGLTYDMEKEEFLVDRVFKYVILYAGDLLLSPSFVADRFGAFVSEHERFKPFVEKGLLRAIEETGERIRTDIYETPKTVSWDRVARKLPAIINDIIDVVEQEKVVYR